MIVVLCSSFEEAQFAYDIFVKFLEENYPWNIKRFLDAAYCVETDDDLKYVFVDYRFRNLFNKSDVIDVDEFFEGISQLGEILEGRI